MSKKKLAEFYFLKVKRYAIYGECIMKTRLLFQVYRRRIQKI